ncbi:MAG: HAMP domain-containing histidine kinase [Flavobacteriales bacterium]|nr:HAMP domain-containing histidine kinase [Flavobacteriales bacterium]MEB2342023.1 HAMP domain-containing sensor histidine kinase [Flavobacteriia bacterium]
MARTVPRPPVLLFGMLALYILLQSAWWMWLLVSKDRDIYALQQQLVGAGLVPELPVRLPRHTLLMVVGEGLVFLILVLLGLWIMFRTVRHELSLARQQRDFLMAAGHELRTPIAALKLHLQTLMRPGLEAESRDALVQNARGDVDRLQALAEQVLLASRLEEHAAAPQQYEIVDVARLTGEILGEARSTYGRSHLLVGRLPATLPLRTDAGSFRTIAGNLLENACKYSPAGTTVAVELGAVPGAAYFRVTDQGAGIAEEDRRNIYTKFYRGGDEATRSTKGTGLGLFIVLRLLQDMGGRIEYRPARPHGSTFTALFPNRP